MKMRMLCMALGLVGCIEGQETWAPEDSVTIATGVYGQTIARCPNVETPCIQKAAPNIAVAAYEGSGLPALTDVPAVVAVSDDRGFFQLSLPRGTYRICRSEQLTADAFVPSSCAGTSTSVSTTVRVDMY